MSEPLSTPDSVDVLVGLFLEELERTEDSAALVEKWSAAHPHLAEEFRDAARFRSVANLAAYTPEPPPDALPDFRIIRRIAAGGMGVVFEAEQVSLKRHVAVKVRRGRLSPRAQMRFDREQLVLARLHQTHIVPIHTSGRSAPWQYFAMAYIHGAGLNHLVQSTRQRVTVHDDGKTPTLAELADEFLKSDCPGDGEAQPPSSEQIAPRSANTDGPGARSQPNEKELTQGPLTLSLGYFRSVAQAIMQAAEALQHAHNAGVLHRDVKPSNMMVDTHGQCWLIDFGLAYCNDLPVGDDDGEDGTEAYSALATRGPLGTPEYMAPEQHTAQATEHSDIWGLGATLYELLTLRRPFHGRSRDQLKEMILRADPAPIGECVCNVPKDLVEIARKCLQKDPAQRYRGMGDVAEDLRHWLKGEPTTARPLWIWQRLWLWARRNPGWAAALVLALLVLVTAGMGALLIAQARAKNAEEQVGAAQRLAENERRERLIQRLLMTRLNPNKRNGWWNEAWAIVKDAADIRTDHELTSQAAASLVGMDASIGKRFEFPASAVVFDPTGERLLIGGATDEGRVVEAKVWDGRKDVTISSKLPGGGPVAFRADGAPLQLVAKDQRSLILWNLAKQESVIEINLPGAERFEGKDAARLGAMNLSEDSIRLPGVEARDATKLRAVHLSEDSSRIAALVTLPDGKAVVRVWESASGRMLHEFPHTGNTNALAISPDNLLLASGDEDGNLRIWSLRDGKRLAVLSSDRIAILSLAFSHDARLREAQDAVENMTGRLAVGDQAATVTVWSLANQQTSRQYHGSPFVVFALAFSPDGSLLASSGRLVVKVWDTASGHLVLELYKKRNATYVGLAFSPDGRKLAVCSTRNYAPGEVVIWDLQFGRGIETLRGLNGQVTKIRFSPDGLHLAAFTHGWQVGIWEIPNGRLRHLLDVPKGVFADGAALEFSPDSRHLAFATYKDAKLWEVESGRVIGSWTFPIGHVTVLSFHPSGKLLLFRLETLDGVWPFGTDPVEHPRVCKIRELLQPDKTRLIKEIHDFNRAVFGAKAPHDATYFAVDGIGGKTKTWDRKIKAFDGLTGKEIFSIDSTWKRDSDAGIYIDSTGRNLFARIGGPTPADEEQRLQVEMPAGRVLGAVEITPKTGDPGRRYWFADNEMFPEALNLVRRQDEKLTVSLRIDSESSVYVTCEQFDTPETQLAWGSKEGTVFVCDIAEVQKRLAAVGLGW